MSKADEKKRAPGFYWVKDESNRWVVAEFVHSGWYVNSVEKICLSWFVADYEWEYGDSDFLRVGPKIDSPDVFMKAERRSVERRQSLKNQLEAKDAQIQDLESRVTKLQKVVRNLCNEIICALTGDEKGEK